jgi:hypothetical protein
MIIHTQINEDSYSKDIWYYFVDTNKLNESIPDQKELKEVLESNVKNAVLHWRFNDILANIQVEMPLLVERSIKLLLGE